MDITSLYNVNSNMIRTAARIQEAEAAAAAGTTINSNNSFSNILNSAIDNINLTNSYLSDMENEELKFALGETDNTHDLLIAPLSEPLCIQPKFSCIFVVDLLLTFGPLSLER